VPRQGLSSARIHSGSRRGTQPVGRRGPRSGRTATGLSPGPRVAQVPLPGLAVGDHCGDRLGQDGTFLLEARGDVQDLLSGVEADIVGRHARSSSPCLARWASWLSGKSTARYPAAVRYQGRKVPRADCSNGQSCRSVIAPPVATGGAAPARDEPAVRAEPSTLAMPPTMALGPIGVASTMTRPRVEASGSILFRRESRIPHRAGLTWVYTMAWPLGRNVSGYHELPCWVVVMRRAVRGTEEGRCGHDASSLLCSL
jgi:hypothetical protein